MAAMMVSAGPAQAQANETNFESGINAVQFGDTFIASGDDFDFGDNDIDGVLFAFDDNVDDVFGDDDEDFGIDNDAFLFCDPCNFDEFDPEGIDIG
jgi:hypothetical protein